ncbi:uncharacterized protein METZ01_LOCUS185939 [marine metagenome]|uniref:Uncharacterized protein n=1 Tax=marine metagenome TaxID=408172 RepID=A0A382D433_9ZZZZ
MRLFALMPTWVSSRSPPTSDCDIQTMIENIVYLLDTQAQKHQIAW